MAGRQGGISERVHIKSVDQKILSGIQWANLFMNPENKKDLTKLVVLISKQMSVEHYLRFHWLSVVVKIYGKLLTKWLNSSQYQTMKNMT